MHTKADLIRCGNKLRQLRLAKGLSAETLAALSGVNTEKIILFEEGNGGDILLTDLLQVAETLNVYLSDILAGN
jgi:transcriptional regulator with XRE-family HTH domain